MIDSPHLLFARIKHAADMEGGREGEAMVVLRAHIFLPADRSCAKEANLRGKKRRRQSSMAPRQIGTMSNQTVARELHHLLVVEICGLGQPFHLYQTAMASYSLTLGYFQNLSIDQVDQINEKKTINREWVLACTHSIKRRAPDMKTPLGSSIVSNKRSPKKASSLK